MLIKVWHNYFFEYYNYIDFINVQSLINKLKFHFKIISFSQY